MPAESKILLRLATPEDVPVLHTLIEASVRGLQTEDYTPAQIDGALQTVFGVDSQLIADGTYIVAEAQLRDQEVASDGPDGREDPRLFHSPGVGKARRRQSGLASL